MAIDGAKFRKPVVPGDVLALDVVPLRKGKAIWKLRGEAKVGGTCWSQRPRSWPACSPARKASEGRPRSGTGARRPSRLRRSPPVNVASCRRGLTARPSWSRPSRPPTVTWRPRPRPNRTTRRPRRSGCWSATGSPRGRRRRVAGGRASEKPDVDFSPRFPSRWWRAGASRCRRPPPTRPCPAPSAGEPRADARPDVAPASSSTSPTRPAKSLLAGAGAEPGQPLSIPNLAVGSAASCAAGAARETTHAGKYRWSSSLRRWSRARRSSPTRPPRSRTSWRCNGEAIGYLGWKRTRTSTGCHGRAGGGERRRRRSRSRSGVSAKLALTRRRGEEAREAHGRRGERVALRNVCVPAAASQVYLVGRRLRLERRPALRRTGPRRAVQAGRRGRAQRRRRPRAGRHRRQHAGKPGPRRRRPVPLHGGGAGRAGTSSRATRARQRQAGAEDDAGSRWRAASRPGRGRRAASGEHAAGRRAAS